MRWLGQEPATRQRSRMPRRNEDETTPLLRRGSAAVDGADADVRGDDDASPSSASASASGSGDDSDHPINSSRRRAEGRRDSGRPLEGTRTIHRAPIPADDECDKSSVARASTTKEVASSSQQWCCRPDSPWRSRAVGREGDIAPAESAPIIRSRNNDGAPAQPLQRLWFVRPPGLAFFLLVAAARIAALRLLASSCGDGGDECVGGVGAMFNKLLRVPLLHSMATTALFSVPDPQESHLESYLDPSSSSSSSRETHHPTVQSRPGFPSYLDYASSSAGFNVTYDSRSLLLNGTRALFLSGSMHPVRATRATWIQGVNEAVRHNLNMVTMYVMWSAHQPHPSTPLNFDVMSTRSPFETSSSSWTLSEAIRIAASRGLFVHIRIGPYVCAEYSYGGIPEWLPLQHPDMDMRRPNRQWYRAMEQYVTSLIRYLSRHKLWAHQGGPIVLAQIENELQGDDADGSSAADLQPYADWCGALAHRVAPDVVWTMCNGLVASNTIETFNGDWSSSAWLAQRGVSRRIQVDQPALWTEDEGGFQIWGDDPDHPSDYYWGRTARDVAFQALKWFARGGAHLNYYMFWGGSNFGRSAAAGIANMYASDAALCSSGQRRQPKFDHLSSLHEALVDAAPILLYAPTALHQNRSTQVWNGTSWGYYEWDNFTVFRYRIALHHHHGRHREAVFVENNSDRDRNVRVKELRSRVVLIKARSSQLFVDGSLRFDSGSLAAHSVSYQREVVRDPIPLTNWSYRIEDGYSDFVSFHPIEQTALMVRANVSSDFAWYTTRFDVSPALTSTGFDVDARHVNVSVRLIIETQQANGLVAYLDGTPLGFADTHQHREGSFSHPFPIPAHIARRIITSSQSHTLDILSESFGHGNLIGVNNTRAKTKGLTGRVSMVFEVQQSESVAPYRRIATVQLADGTFVWGSMAGLNRGPSFVSDAITDGSDRGAGAAPRKSPRRRRRHTQTTSNSMNESLHVNGSYRIGGMWSSVQFPTPEYDPERQALFVEMRWGRGHFWLNGVDMGRYWNITSPNRAGYEAKGGTPRQLKDEDNASGEPFYTQRYYYLPPDLLVDPGTPATTTPTTIDSATKRMNVLELFDSLGWPSPDYLDERHRPKLVLSWSEPSDKGNFDDVVGFPDACLY